MNILAIDTTSERGSLALRRDGLPLAEVDLHSTVGYSQLLFPAIADLLRTHQLALEEIDCFAAAAGPGAFTGVRVGLAAAKGLAEASGKSAAGVSNLRALATFGHSARRAAILDARRGDVFAAVYDGKLSLVSPEVVLRLEAWPLDADEYIVRTGSTFIAQLPPDKLTFAPVSLAGAVAFCAELDWARNNSLDPALLDANYVRRSDAELFWSEPVTK